jgi:3',5'-cyclic AMP phosphodiesterase CpdA
MSTKPFGCPWDSGQVGFIFATKETLIKEYGRADEDIINKAKEILEAEVKVYDQYLTREVYGYRIYEVSTCDHGHEHREEVESSWGYYGEDICLKEAESVVNCIIKKK